MMKETNPGLRDVARRAKLPFRIGTAVSFFGEPKKLGNYEPGIFRGEKFDLERDAAYEKVLLREFDAIEPGNELKMSGPWKGVKRDSVGNLAAVCDFANLERAAGYARERKIGLRGHVIVYSAWYQLPQALFNIDWSTQKVTLKPEFSPDDVRSAVKSYVEQVVYATLAINAKTRRESGQKKLIFAWDVTNECVPDGKPTDGPNGFRYPESDLWHNSGPKTDGTGWDYLADLFRWAGDAMDAAIRARKDGIEASDRFALYYNDYNGEYSPEKWEAIKNVARHVRKHGGRLDGVGFQTHLIATKDERTKGQLERAVRETVALGLRFSITECDVRLRVPAKETPLETQRLWQVENYRAIAAVCRKYASRCDLLQLWGFHDDGSWIPATFGGFGEATPFTGWNPATRTYEPKPAANALAEGLRGQNL